MYSHFPLWVASRICNESLFLSAQRIWDLSDARRGTGKKKSEPATAVVCTVMTEELTQSWGHLHSSLCSQHCMWSLVVIKKKKVSQFYPWVKILWWWAEPHLIIWVLSMSVITSWICTWNTAVGSFFFFSFRKSGHLKIGIVLENFHSFCLQLKAILFKPWKGCNYLLLQLKP